MKDIIHIKSISQVHDLLGIAKPRHPLVSILPIDQKMIDFDYGDHNYTFDFYQISLKEGLKGSWTYGRNSYDFNEGAMVFMKPKQIIKMDQPREQRESNGWTLIFHPDLIHKSDLGDKITEYNFFSYEVSEALHLSHEEKKTLTDLVEKIQKEYESHIDKYSQELIISNIHILLKYCKRYYDRQFYTRTNLNKDWVTKFEKMIVAYYESDKVDEHGVLSVKYCAKMLNMSANYLGDLIKNETGQSAKEHIQNYIVEKAKTRLLGTNKSMSEIAYEFGFEYPQGFNKLFKAKVGMSPSKYKMSRTIN